MFFGIDLTSSENKSSTCVCLNEKLHIVSYDFFRTNSEIIAEIAHCSPQTVAIDSPLNLPLGLCCLNHECACQPRSPLKGRSCERELAKLGIPCYFTTKKSIIKEMVKRAMMLKTQLEQQGYEVIEVYPYASKVRLFGKLKPKNTPKGISQFRRKLSQLLKTNSPIREQWNDDLCDAAVVAYTGYLYAHGKIEAVGNVEEGVLYLPRSSCGRRGSG